MANATGSTVIYYDYAGYGLSEGRSNERNMKADALEVYQYVRVKYAGTLDSRITLIGHSLGSTPAIHTAVNYTKVRQVILISALASAFKMVCSWRIFRPFDILCNDTEIPYISAPILLFHGLEDKVIPFTHSERLNTLAKDSTSILFLLENAGHNDILQGKYKAKVLQKIKEICAF